MRSHYEVYKEKKIENASAMNMWINSLPIIEELQPVFFQTSLLLPFKPNYSQIIYVEDEYRPHLNNYIQKNIKLIDTLFKHYSYKFIYLPYEIAKCENKGEILNYMFPLLEIDEQNRLIDIWQDFSTEKYSRILFSILGIPDSELKAGLLRVRNFIIKNQHSLSFVELPKENCSDDIILAYFLNYFRTGDCVGAFSVYDCKKRNIFCCKEITYGSIVEEKDPNYADTNFCEDMYGLTLEVKEKIEKLRQEGYLELLLQLLGQDITRDITQLTLKPKLSKLLITDEFDIVLPDFDNLEIKLTPLPKAVYLLFLRHPEGIRFKTLPAYREELLEIYKHVSVRESLETMKESIDSVIDPTRNAINEKCSRIREAFLLHFDDYVSRNYYITGTRGEYKQVVLDPLWVKLPETICGIHRTVVEPR